jgi:hypothetical protein
MNFIFNKQFNANLIFFKKHNTCIYRESKGQRILFLDNQVKILLFTINYVQIENKNKDLNFFSALMFEGTSTSKVNNITFNELEPLKD